MTIKESNNYVLKWQLKYHPEYKFTDSGICFNTKTGNRIKKIVNGRSVGFCIKGKFRSINTIRKELVKIEIVECPF